MNFSLIFIIFFLLFFLLFSSLLFYIPICIIYFIYPKYNNIINLIKNIYGSSLSFIIYLLLDTKIYVNSLNIFEDITNHPNEKNIIIANHVSEIDFFIYAFIINNVKNLFYVKSNFYIKKILGYFLIGTGIIGILSNDKYLDRNITSDYNKISINLDTNLIFIYPEGTCFTTRSKLKSDYYCKNNNLPIFKYHLYPRITGIKKILENNPKISNIYDLTVVYNTINKNKYY